MAAYSIAAHNWLAWTAEGWAASLDALERVRVPVQTAAQLRLRGARGVKREDAGGAGQAHADVGAGVHAWGLARVDEHVIRAVRA